VEPAERMRSGMTENYPACRARINPLLLLLDQQGAFTLDGGNYFFRDLGEEPRQRHLQPQMIVHYVDPCSSVLPDGADAHIEPVATPRVLVERDEARVFFLHLRKSVLDAPLRSLAAELMRNRHDQWLGHRRPPLRAKCVRSIVTLRRLARHATSKKSPAI